MKENNVQESFNAFIDSMHQYDEAREVIEKACEVHMDAFNNVQVSVFIDNDMQPWVSRKTLMRVSETSETTFALAQKVLIDRGSLSAYSGPENVASHALYTIAKIHGERDHYFNMEALAVFAFTIYTTPLNRFRRWLLQAIKDRLFNVKTEKSIKFDRREGNVDYYTLSLSYRGNYEQEYSVEFSNSGDEKQ